MVERICQDVLEAELTEYLNAGPWERAQGRTGYRNGYKDRAINTRIGTLRLQVPYSRDGGFAPRLFARYQRSERALQATLMEMVLQGVSTRRVGRVTELLCGRNFSAETVANLCKQMDGPIRTFLSRPLRGSYPYVIFDARYEKVRVADHVVDQAVLVIVGVNDGGYREVLGVEIGDLESESTWGDIFGRLRDRGLSGVRMVVSDDHRGLRKAIARYFGGIMWQRCQLHFLRNLCGHVPRSARKELAATLHRLWESGDPAVYRRDLALAVEQYRSRWPKVAALLETDTDDTMQVMHVPEEHRKRLRTTNVIERVNEMIRARTRVVRIFPNRESCLRLVTAILMELHEDWITGYRYLTFSEEPGTPAESTAAVPEKLVAVAT